MQAAGDYGTGGFQKARMTTVRQRKRKAKNRARNKEARKARRR